MYFSIKLFNSGCASTDSNLFFIGLYLLLLKIEISFKESSLFKSSFTKSSFIFSIYGCTLKSFSQSIISLLLDLLSFKLAFDLIYSYLNIKESLDLWAMDYLLLIECKIKLNFEGFRSSS